eukprot:gnl/Dysnectes_brevis/6288_a9647_317.p1 GENE.gnl/Dysnectes_brevis/6288_a9647_317~~gnl/Dysnectes_brevis/6288_a9647_317.p1  ORF type:complete len:683 (+),score=49.76 gnl/Dysnectes_brevis/6288_a9647_317:22-2070(+)
MKSERLHSLQRSHPFVSKAAWAQARKLAKSNPNHLAWFWNLFEFNAQHQGVILRTWPNVKGQPIDLRLLDELVEKSGGFSKANFTQIATQMKFKNTDQAVPIIISTYKCFLSPRHQSLAGHSTPSHNLINPDLGTFVGGSLHGKKKGERLSVENDFRLSSLPPSAYSKIEHHQTPALNTEGIQPALLGRIRREVRENDVSMPIYGLREIETICATGFARAVEPQVSSRFVHPCSHLVGLPTSVDVVPGSGQAETPLGLFRILVPELGLGAINGLVYSNFPKAEICLRTLRNIAVTGAEPSSLVMQATSPLIAAYAAITDCPSVLIDIDDDGNQDIDIYIDTTKKPSFIPHDSVGVIQQRTVYQQLRSAALELFIALGPRIRLDSLPPPLSVQDVLRALEDPSIIDRTVLFLGAICGRGSAPVNRILVRKELLASNSFDFIVERIGSDALHYAPFAPGSYQSLRDLKQPIQQCCGEHASQHRQSTTQQQQQHQHQFHNPIPMPPLPAGASSLAAIASKLHPHSLPEQYAAIAARVARQKAALHLAGVLSGCRSSPSDHAVILPLRKSLLLAVEWATLGITYTVSRINSILGPHPHCSVTTAYGYEDVPQQPCGGSTPDVDTHVQWDVEFPSLPQRAADFVRLLIEDAATVAIHGLGSVLVTSSDPLSASSLAVVAGGSGPLAT